MADRKRIGLREVRALKPGGTVWDADCAGFGARRQRGAAVSYQVLYRTAEGRQRWFTIGRHGSPWTPDTARAEARRILGEKVRGADPAADKKAKRQAATVAELLDLYWSDAVAGRLLTRRGAAKKASTLLTDKGRIERHIRPLLGHRKVASVSSQDIEGFVRAVSDGKTAVRAKAPRRGAIIVRGGRGTATRTVGLLGAIFNFAVKRRMRADNPVKGVVLAADGRRERRLSDHEYAAFGAALRQAADARIWPAAVAATRFLALTGWRSGEALALRWKDVDLARRTAILPDSKTGRSMRPLSHAACEVLRGLGRGADSNLVFPATRGDGLMGGFRKHWDKIAALGALPPDVTPHVLRHSFASLAADMEFAETTIAALLGHAGRSITSRYLHSADATLLAAADAVARRTAELMGDARPGDVVPLPVRAAG